MSFIPPIVIAPQSKKSIHRPKEHNITVDRSDFRRKEHYSDKQSLCTSTIKSSYRLIPQLPVVTSLGGSHMRTKNAFYLEHI
jgi:hypothetical protein